MEWKGRGGQTSSWRLEEPWGSQGMACVRQGVGEEKQRQPRKVYYIRGPSYVGPSECSPVQHLEKAPNLPLPKNRRCQKQPMTASPELQTANSIYHGRFFIKPVLLDQCFLPMKMMNKPSTGLSNACRSFCEACAGRWGLAPHRGQRLVAET